MVLHGFWLLKEASETMGFLCPIKPMSVSDLWTPIKDEYHRTHALRELEGFFLFLFFFFLPCLTVSQFPDQEFNLGNGSEISES